MAPNHPQQAATARPLAAAQASPERGPFGTKEVELLSRAGFDVNDSGQPN